MRWSIDAGDAYSVAKVRRAVVEELQTIATEDADLFTLETVLGELLGGEMERGHAALAVIIEQAAGGPVVHVYTQDSNAGKSTRGELREAILSGARLPMSVEVTNQSTHYSLRVPLREETPVNPATWEVVRRAR